MSLLIKNNHPLWGIWKIEETSTELYYKLAKKELYRPFYESKATENRKKEWLATRILLAELLREEIQICYTEQGAPYLSGLNQSISISHTKGYVAVIVGEKPVGIDIEYSGERILKVRSRFMNPEEEAGIDKKNEVNHLLIHWCAKETLFKMISQQDVDFKEHLRIAPFTYHTEGLITCWETRTPHKQTFYLQYWVTPQFILTYSC